MSTATTILNQVLPILQSVITDAPTAVKVLELVLPAIQAGRNLTADEWTQLNSIADAANDQLAADTGVPSTTTTPTTPTAS